MPNLIAGKEIVPELLQHDFTSKKVVECLRPLLKEGMERITMMRQLELVRERLKQERGLGTAADRAADAVLKVATAIKP
jgi:lipid A disaccharide synthetase